MFKIVLTNRQTGERSEFGETFTTEEKAVHICEMWGWFYDDGVMSYYMEVEEV